MTLHWWQHWFWITGRAPVLVLLLAVCGHVCSQQPPWVPGGPVPGAGGLQDPDGAVLLHVPVELRIPVAVAPWAAPWPWAPRRLLGFASPAQESTESAATSTPVAEPPAVAADGAVASEASSTGAPPAVTYLTSLGPSHPAYGPGSSTSQPRAREPKAIGVDPSAAPPPPPQPPRAVTATSVLEIIEEVSPTELPSPAASAPSSSAMEDAMEGEMANDEPARGNASSDATTAESTATPSSASASAAASASPTLSGALSLSSAPPGPAPTAGSAVSGPSPSAAVVAASRVPVVPSASPTTSQVPAHPGLSTPRRFTLPAATSTTPGPVNLTTVGTSEASAETSSTAADEAHVRQSASTSLGSAPAAPASRQHRPGLGAGPGAMSLSSGSGLDAGSITGIVLGIVVFAGLVGTVSFVLYRRRYLNKPQTLSDKCSNPDSSGYIDDSTLRENSEEMYSLDNDSFLNSLEAMTIQNYWTDTVKHTKL